MINLIDKKYGECACHNVDEIVNKILDIIGKEYSFEDRKIYSRKNQANQISNFIEKIIEERIWKWKFCIIL